MLSFWFSVLLSASFTRHGTSMPTARTDHPAMHEHLKRSTIGPQLGGLNFPDPSIIKVDGVWYSFATRTLGSNTHIQMSQSPDFNTFSLVQNDDGSERDALPDLPGWVNSTSWNTWAPDIQQLDNGTFVMYYAATTNAQHAQHCVGAAFSSTITGPYLPQNTPLYCPLAQGGAIDAAGYNDNGQRYVVYKVDGNSLGPPPTQSTPLILQAVEADGVTPQGQGIVLLNNNGAADEGCIEAPSLVQVGNNYVLFFSSGNFATESYTVSYATANTITGPYTRAARPIFQTGDNGLISSGGASIDADAEHMVFHARYGTGRALYTAAISWQ